MSQPSECLHSNFTPPPGGGVDRIVLYVDGFIVTGGYETLSVREVETTFQLCT